MSKITTSISRGVMKTVGKAKKHSPEILIFVGIGGIITATVMACKATLKAEEIIAETRESLDHVHRVHEAEQDSGKYTDEDVRKDTAIIYVKTVAKFAKLYGPSVLIGAASIGAILKSHGIMKKRNVALASAYATLDHGFKKYKDRVAERFGKDVEKEIRYGLKSQEFEKLIKDENGEEKKVKETVDVIENQEVTPYSRFFDESCLSWTKDPQQNLTFLMQTEDSLNDRLVAHGFVTLNEAYRAIGLPEINAGLRIGWVYDPNIENKISFGVHNVHRKSSRDFVNGYERVILLDFNVDGDIEGKIDEARCIDRCMTVRSYRG